MNQKLSIIICLVIGALVVTGACVSDEKTPIGVDGEMDMETNATGDHAYFAAGCFWGVEAAFRNVEGVIGTSVGYMGGTLENPTYRDVSTGSTGHAETVEVRFDPNTVTYDELLDLFWSIHDPTTLNRQGLDVGTQYRSIIFYSDKEQQSIALASKERLEKSGRYNKPIVTEILPVTTYWKAEEYHQQYFEKRGYSR
jgi:peptide-methionine (S)-S-oxide reductase